MSQSLTTIEQVFRPVISAAFKSLENKTYDTNREDYMDVLLEDLFTILFPKKEALITTAVTAPTSPPKEKKKPGPKPKESPPKAESSPPKEKKKSGPKPKASKTEGEGETSPPKEKKKPGPKPKDKESPPKANPSPKTPPKEEEKKKPGPKPKLDENGNPVNKPRQRSPPKAEEEKKKPGPKPKLDDNGNPVNKPRSRSPKSEPAPTSPPKLPPSPVNVAKIDPTIRKKLKEAAKELKVTYEKEQDATFLTWVNSLSPEEFKELGDEYPKRYFQKDTATTPSPSPVLPPQPPTPNKKETESKEEQEVESELVEVYGEKGESYWLDKQTGRIYEGEGEFDPEVGYDNYKPLGYAGEGPFKNIKV